MNSAAIIYIGMILILIIGVIITDRFKTEMQKQVIGTLFIIAIMAFGFIAPHMTPEFKEGAADYPNNEKYLQMKPAAEATRFITHSSLYCSGYEWAARRGANTGNMTDLERKIANGEV